jgi:hypothetical protein
MDIVLDFDGTCVVHKYPLIGEELPFCFSTLTELQKNHRIILNTMRSGKFLDEAVNYLKNKKINLYGINENPDQKSWTNSPKIFGNIYIDDSNLGIPLIKPFTIIKTKPYVDWFKCCEILKKDGLIKRDFVPVKYFINIK